MKTKKQIQNFIFVMLILVLSLTQSFHATATDESMLIYSVEKKPSNPVEIPKEVLKVLRKDQRNQQILANQKTVSEIPSSWFVAENINLNGDNLPDLIVLADNNDLFGANLAPFWIFLASQKGYTLVLSTNAHSLAISQAETGGYHDIQASSATAKAIRTAIYKFDGSQYVAK